MKFMMISFFISLIVIFKYCEAVYFPTIHHITITEFNVDAVKLIQKGFKGINGTVRKNICSLLSHCRWYIFKPLPINRGSLLVLLSTIKEINSSEERSWKLRSISSHQDLPNSLPLQDSSGSQELTRNKKNTVLENIYVGAATNKVSAVPCKFGDFIIYLVPAKNIVHLILFIKENDNSPVKPLGFAATFIGFEKLDEIPNVTFTELIEAFNNEQVTSTKKNWIIYSESDDINQMEKNKLKNLTVCVWLYDNFLLSRFVLFEHEEETDEGKMKYEIGEISLQKSGLYGIINCSISKFNQKIHSFTAFEHPTENKIYVCQRSSLQLDQIYVYEYTL